ncbi:uncharacterized protein [Physcomitrium patens]|uniref:Uncharacterized protein n=1 Tax=Physcomitrium patens TaxID=3218 RepID=A0A2K1L3F4_PHYPA|nr:uncharacterized protein LOC112276053 [Physcomitrium patens]PNR60546.1 hypothetical protein PHYPA_003339 [Physcomitrium patens]|eukprot:XP_024362785.1 uncharacterized protein LOC112276053 [Physcomitrella patens]
MTRLCEVVMWALVLLRAIYGIHADFIAPLCNADENSGLTTDCAQVIAYLQDLGSMDCCRQQYHSVNHCTTLHTSRTCRAQICGFLLHGITDRCQPCEIVAEYVRTLTNECAVSIDGVSRSGGAVVMKEDQGLIIVLL